MLSAEKISTGKLILKTDWPETRFFAILERINFKTPFWSSIFFLWIKIIPPSLSSWIHSFFQIGCPSLAYKVLDITMFFYIGSKGYWCFLYAESMIICPSLFNCLWIERLVAYFLSVLGYYYPFIYPISSMVLTLNRFI